MQISRTILDVTILACSLVSLTLAQTTEKPALEQLERPCWKRANTQDALNQCANRDLQAAEEELQQTYGALLKKLEKDPVAAAALQKAQEAWKAYRDAQLLALHPERTAPGSYGTVLPMCEALEAAALTHDRTRVLKQMLDPVQGDLCSYMHPMR